MLLIKIPVQYSGLTKIGDEAADSTNKVKPYWFKFNPLYIGIPTCCIIFFTDGFCLGSILMQMLVNGFRQCLADAFHFFQVLAAGGNHAAQTAEAGEQGLAAFAAYAGDVA
ncbi:Uncharacterised protein [Neisseria meningitidis]|nr:Uncharacterised protein [Neisseria meningitidis]